MGQFVRIFSCRLFSSLNNCDRRLKTKKLIYISVTFCNSSIWYLHRQRISFFKRTKKAQNTSSFEILCKSGTNAQWAAKKLQFWPPTVNIYTISHNFDKFRFYISVTLTCLSLLFYLPDCFLVGSYQYLSKH